MNNGEQNEARSRAGADRRMVTAYHTLVPSCPDHDAFQSLLAGLSVFDQTRISRLRKLSDRLTRMAGKMLLLHGLLEHGQPAVFLKRILLSYYGKPFVAADLSFNLSHAKQMAVCAFSDDGAALGVDVEALEQGNFDFIKKLMTAKELAQLQNRRRPQQCLCDWWTRKEAVCKADGRGLHVPLNRIRVHGQKATLFSKTWFLHGLDLGKGYRGVVATDKKRACVQQKEIAWDSLTDGFLKASKGSNDSVQYRLLKSKTLSRSLCHQKGP